MEQLTHTTPTLDRSSSSGAPCIAADLESEIRRPLPELVGWSYQPEEGGALYKEFRFNDFVGAFGFMAQVALHAERLNHHPEWTNVYDRVTVRLTTHDVAGLSAKDFEMARWMDRLHTPIDPPGPDVSPLSDTASKELGVGPVAVARWTT